MKYIKHAIYDIIELLHSIRLRLYIFLLNKISKLKYYSKSNRVLILAHFGSYGGITTYCNALIQLCIENKIEIFFLARNDFQNNYISTRFKNKLKVVQFDYDFHGVKSFMPVYTKLLWLINEYSISHVVISECAEGNMLPLLKLPLKVFLIEHTLPSSSIRKSYKVILSKRDLKKSTIITVSDYMKHSFLSLNPWLTNVQRIYNSGELDCAYKKSIPSQFQVLTIAHVVEYKNPTLWYKVACKVCKLDPDIRFVWVGDGPLFDVFKSKDTHRIKFVGRADPSLVVEYYKESSLYLALSTTESLGIAVIDAQSYGLPAIVTNVGGLPEVVEHNYNGLIFDDLDNIVDGIIQMKRDSQLYQKFSNNSKQKYDGYFSKTKWKATMSDLFNIRGAQ